jgi:hypothetical protein
VIINNGDYLTAVKAGVMRHWTAPLTEADIRLAEAPQTIDIPATGQVVRSEKTLVEPKDELTIKISYVWKGTGK